MAAATSFSSSALAYLSNSSTPLSNTTRKSRNFRVHAELVSPNSSTPLSNTMRTKPSSSNSTEMLRDYVYFLDSPVYPNESVFKKKKIYLPCYDDYFVEGGRCMFNFLPGAFEGIKQIGVLGYDSQVTAHARHLRDSLAAVESDTVIKVGLRKCSHTFPVAREAGFTEENGTLGDIYETIAGSDLVLFLNSDATDADDYKEVLSHMKPNSILGLSHRFLPRHLESMGLEFPKNIGVIAVYPRATHPGLRKLWVQGEEYLLKTKLNSSFRVHQDIDGRGTDVAIGWSIALGSPFTFAATLEPMLHGRSSARNGESDNDAYNMFEHRTGITSEYTSKKDLLALYNSMEDNVDIPTAYGASYNLCMGNSYGCSASWLSRYTEKGKSAYKNIFEYSTGIVSKTALMVIWALSISLTGVGKAAACSASYHPCINNLYDVAAGSDIRSSFFAVCQLYESLFLASPMGITDLTRWLKYVTVEFPWNLKLHLGFGPAVGPPPPYLLIASCAFALGVFFTLTLMRGSSWFCHHHSCDTMLAASSKRGRGRPKTTKKVSKNQHSLRLLAEMTKKQEVSEDS